MDEEYIKLTQEWHRKGFESRQAEVDELQKRIDEALKALEKLDGYDYNENLDAVFLILKGATP